MLTTATLVIRTENGEETISGRILIEDAPMLLDATRAAIERYRRFTAREDEIWLGGFMDDSAR